MKYYFNLICLLIAQKAYNIYLWFCSETLPLDCNYIVLNKKIQSRAKIFKAFLDATRLRPRHLASNADKKKEMAKLKKVRDDLYSKYAEKVSVFNKQ